MYRFNKINEKRKGREYTCLSLSRLAYHGRNSRERSRAVLKQESESSKIHSAGDMIPRKSSAVGMTGIQADLVPSRETLRCLVKCRQIRSCGREFRLAGVLKRVIIGGNLYRRLRH